MSKYQIKSTLDNGYWLAEAGNVCWTDDERASVFDTPSSAQAVADSELGPIFEDYRIVAIEI